MSGGGGRRANTRLCNPGLLPLSGSGSERVAAAPITQTVFRGYSPWQALETQLSPLAHLRLKDVNGLMLFPRLGPPPLLLAFLNASHGSVSNSFTRSLDFKPSEAALPL